jgi:dCMP deaminase
MTCNHGNEPVECGYCFAEGVAADFRWSAREKIQQAAQMFKDTGQPLTLKEVSEILGLEIPAPKVKDDGRRPNWTNYFLGLAFMVSRRSHDIHTQHGCVITDRNNHIIGTGYNGFPRGMDDASLPTNRPDPDRPDELNKYDFVDGTHSERNAIAHCMVSPWLIPGGAIAYVTGEPCNACLSAMWQANITTVYYADRHGSYKLNERTRQVQKIIVDQTGIKVFCVKPDLNWLHEGLDKIVEAGFAIDREIADD